MTTNPTPDLCPNCQHPQHTPGTECETQVSHGPNRWHLCLCLARPGAALPCPPQMTCQGGTLGYADIWYLQQGHTLMSTEGEISPEVLKTGPVSVGFPSDPAASAVVAVAAPPTGQTALRDRIAEVLARFGDVDQHAMAAAVLAVLPAGSEDTTTTRADALAEAIAAVEAERDATDVNVAVYPRYDQRQRNALDSGIRVLRRLAAETRQGCTLCGHLTCVGGHPCGVISTQQGDLPEPCACTGPAEPTAEETARNHVIALHQIGEQLAGIESWMWEHLADVRGAARQPAASAGVQTDEETSR